MSNTAKTTANATTKNAKSDTNGFVFFKGHASVNKKSPKITVRKNGLIVLNAGAVASLGETTHVQLGYDAERKAVAIRSAESDAEGSYLLGKGQNDRQRKIHGKRFFAHHGIATASARSYPVEDFGHGLMGFHMSEEPDTPAGGKSRAEA